MQPRDEPPPIATSLLTIQGGSSVWAIPGAAVVGIEPFVESAETPLDMLALLGAPALATATSQAARVIVVQAGGEQLRLLARGALTLTETAAENLLPLPNALQIATPLVSHIAVVDGKPALFVVSPERLLQAVRSGRAPSSTFQDSARGSSC